ncbi:MAG: hypothetical protein CVU42_00210 [Chloroflexi bacterium HGW-Chloroflexi-4]|jgi:hypothetical protein|nr:MAG: hypothetical protein CVU42_00210 [Chloroflexi bacterium HGW-Chloroflexi-4]
MQKKLKGLYYPYSRCLDEITLKKSLLVFDELYFIDPVERLIREYIGERERFPRIRHLSEVYEELENAEIAKRVNPFPQIRGCDTLLWEAAATDEKNNDFRELLKAEEIQDSWAILENKYTGANVVYLSRDINTALGYAMGGMSEIEAKAKGFFGTIQDFSSQYIMVTAHKYVPPALGLSLGINHTLLVSENSDFIPFTDSPIAHKALLFKYQRALANKTGQNSLHITPSVSDEQKFISLSFHVFENFLDEEELSKRSIQEILSFRRACSSEFEKFRVALRGLAFEIEGQIWDEDFRIGVLKTINNNIAKEISSLEDEVAKTYENMFGNLIKKASALVTPTLLGTVLAGLSPGQILGYSTMAITGAIGMTIPEFIDAWLGKKNLRRNSFSLLLEARRRLGKKDMNLLKQ